MARGGAEALFKKNNKLESYLKRTLTDETFERVRAYESCIIVSEKENKTFKYVVLGDEWIYLTENPPKTLQETVHLKDIVSVELVNDYPDFLSGEERENTQHLAVTYWTSDGKRRSIRKSRKSPRGGSTSDLQGDRSNASTPLGYVSQESGVWSVDDVGIATQSLSSLHIGRPDSRGSVGSNRESSKSSSLKKKKNRLGDSTEETYLKSLKEESEDQGLDDIDENDVSTTSTNIKALRKRELPESKTSRRKSSTDGSSLKGDSISNTGSVKRPLPQGIRKTAFENTSSTNVNEFSEKPPLDNELVVGTVDVYEEEEKPTFCCSALNCLNGKNKILPFCSRSNKLIQNDLKSHPSQDFPVIEVPIKSDLPPPPEITVDIKSDMSRLIQRGSISSLQDAPPSRRSSITTLRGPPSRVGTPALESEPTFTRSVSNLGMASYSDLGGSMNGLSVSGPEPGFSERRKTVLNIYLLNLHSPMLMLIRSAWSNYLIRCTLMLDPEYEQVFKSIIIRSGTQNQRLIERRKREKMEVLFGQLKRELFNPENQMDETFGLLNELRVATERNFALKKMFWKNADMFLFLVKQLQRYLPKSPININTDHGRLLRVDEFELAILLTDILSLMFRESEIIPARIQTLKAERGRSVLDLLMVLTCTPEVPEKFSAPTFGTVSGSFKGGDAMTVNTDKEIETQLTQFTKTALMAVYELFLMAKQANWGYSEGNFFNIGWMVKVLEEIRTTEKFVDRVIQQMMKLIGPVRRAQLDPVEGVLLYMQFSVLQTFLQYSPRIAGFIRNNYLEEFKYFVQVPAIAKKLPLHFPVINIMMPLIESVMNKVLEKHTLAYPKSPRS